MKHLIPLVALAITFLLPVDAFAWKQTMTCDSILCNGYPPMPISWTTPCIPFHLNEKGTRQMTNADVQNALIASINAWYHPEISTLTPHFSGMTGEDSVGYRPAYTNANIIVFRDDDWNESRAMLALTSVTHNNADGEIFDADIEINTQHYAYGIYEVNGAQVVDLQNTLTHELGHAFGLDHTDVLHATMTSYATQGDTSLRTLEDDDFQAIAAIYPRGSLACTFSNDYFIPESILKPKDEGCSATPRSPNSPSPWIWFLLATMPTLTLLRKKSPCVSRVDTEN